MELALSESLIYLPPLALAALLAFYRNNILCFWDCNPVGITAKEFTGQMAVRISALLQMAQSTALAIRNFPTSLVALARNTQLMLVNMIQGILVTIKASIGDMILKVNTFLKVILASIQNYTSYLKNTTVDFFRPVEVAKYSYAYLLIAAIGLTLCAFVVWREYQRAKNAPISEHPMDTLEEEPVKESVEVIEPVKKPIRRRAKKTD